MPGFKGGWFVVVAYVVGFIKMLIVIGWNPAPERRPKHGSPGGGVVQVSSIVREDGSGPEALNKSLESFFAVRESRYLAETIGSNKLAELDLYLRQSRLRTPVLEVLGSDAFRFAIAERTALKSNTPPLETLPDLIAGALARRDIDGAIRLLESEKDNGVAGLNDIFLLTYLYCLNGSVDKAEALAVANAASIKKDWFVDWLWRKLETDFGFHPPR